MASIVRRGTYAPFPPGAGHSEVNMQPTKKPTTIAKRKFGPVHEDAPMGKAAKAGGTGRVVGHNATEKRKAVATELRSRIVGHATVDPHTLKAHNLNFRRHGATQVTALAGSLNDLGWVKSVLVSKRTGTIIDGHARVEEALRRKCMVPVEYVDLTKDEENKALALLDPITEMATRDDAMFMELLSSISSDDAKINETLQKLAPLKEDKAEELSGGKVNESTKILEYTTDVFFPSTSKWGIPDILPNMLYDGPPPVSTWPFEPTKKEMQCYVFGEGGFDERLTGKILTFYTEDWRFERIWTESVDTIKTVVPLKPAAACQPDFSLWGTDPLAVQMYNLYRARWISRYWQEAGIKLIPSIAFSFYEPCFEFITHGLPKEIPMASIQVRSDGLKTKMDVSARVDAVKRYLKDCKIGHIVVYGSENAYNKLLPFLPKGPKYSRCMPFSEAWFINGQKIGAAKKAANLEKLRLAEK